MPGGLCCFTQKALLTVKLMSVPSLLPPRESQCENEAKTESQLQISCPSESLNSFSLCSPFH